MRCLKCGNLMLYNPEEDDYQCMICSDFLKYQLEPRPQLQPTSGREPGIAGIRKPYK